VREAPAPEYRFDPGKIKIKLMSIFVAKGIDVMSALECAHDCVTAGKTTAFWRDRMAVLDADALDKDLERMKA
jgi:hypothetical protein